jgi:hypothetical protein
MAAEQLGRFLDCYRNEMVKFAAVASTYTGLGADDKNSSEW